MSRNRAGKWSTKQRMYLSIVILIAFVIGFFALYFYFNGPEASDNDEVEEEPIVNDPVEQEPIVKDEAQEIRELIAQFYKDEAQSELDETADITVLDEINERIEKIADLDLRYELSMEAASVVVFSLTEEKINRYLVDGVLVEKLDAQEIERLAEDLEFAEIQNPNYAAKLKERIDDIKAQYEEENAE